MVELNEHSMSKCAKREIAILIELVPTAHLARFYIADNAADLHDIADTAYTSRNTITSHFLPRRLSHLLCTFGFSRQ